MAREVEKGWSRSIFVEKRDFAPVSVSPTCRQVRYLLCIYTRSSAAIPRTVALDLNLYKGGLAGQRAARSEGVFGVAKTRPCPSPSRGKLARDECGRLHYFL